MMTKWSPVTTFCSHFQLKRVATEEILMLYLETIKPDILLKKKKKVEPNGAKLPCKYKWENLLYGEYSNSFLSFLSSQSYEPGVITSILQIGKLRPQTQQGVKPKWALISILTHSMLGQEGSWQCVRESWEHTFIMSSLSSLLQFPEHFVCD